MMRMADQKARSRGLRSNSLLGLCPQRSDGYQDAG